MYNLIYQKNYINFIFCVISSRNKFFKENMKSLDEGDEKLTRKDHERTRRGRNTINKQNVFHVNSEYACMIEMSENLGRGDAKMDYLGISNDEEER